MTEVDLSAGSLLKEFVKQTIAQIDDALREIGNTRVVERVNFNLKTTVSSDAKGGLNIYVVKLGTDVKSEQVQEINFSADSKDTAERQLKNQELLLKKLINEEQEKEKREGFSSLVV